MLPEFKADEGQRFLFLYLKDFVHESPCDPGLIKKETEKPLLLISYAARL